MSDQSKAPDAKTESKDASANGNSQKPAKEEYTFSDWASI